MPLEHLERLGIQLAEGGTASAAAAAPAARAGERAPPGGLFAELEAQQRTWRWVLAVGASGAAGRDGSGRAAAARFSRHLGAPGGRFVIQSPAQNPATDQLGELLRRQLHPLSSGSGGGSCCRLDPRPGRCRRAGARPAPARGASRMDGGAGLGGCSCWRPPAPRSGSGLHLRRLPVDHRAAARLIEAAHPELPPCCSRRWPRPRRRAGAGLHAGASCCGRRSRAATPAGSRWSPTAGCGRPAAAAAVAGGVLVLLRGHRPAAQPALPVRRRIRAAGQPRTHRGGAGHAGAGAGPLRQAAARPGRPWWCAGRASRRPAWTCAARWTIPCSAR